MSNITPDTERPMAVIYASEIELIARYTADYPQSETGGDLFGYWSYLGHPIIHLALGPGPSARRTTTSFYQDVSYLRMAANELRLRHGLLHVGEWHSHHTLGLPHPSAGDIESVRRGLVEFPRAQFFVSVASLKTQGRASSPPATAPSRCTIGGYLFGERFGAEPRDCEWKVLKGISPIRNAVLWGMGGQTADGRSLLCAPTTTQCDFDVGLKDDAAISPPAPRFASSQASPFANGYWLASSEGARALAETQQSLGERRITSTVQLEGSGTCTLLLTRDDASLCVHFPLGFPAIAPQPRISGSSGLLRASWPAGQANLSHALTKFIVDCFV